MIKTKDTKSIRVKLGYSSLTKEELKPLSLDEILTQSEKLNQAPIEQIQKLINKRIVDIRVIPQGNKSICKENKVTDCLTTIIEFQIMFENIMVGYRAGGTAGSNGALALATHTDNFYSSFNKLFNIKNFARKGGYMFLSVLYTHHTKGHRSTESYNPFRYKFDRSPFNMSIDRIDSKLGYVKGNIQLICVWMQTAKLDYDIDDFKNWVIEAGEFMETST